MTTVATLDTVLRLNSTAFRQGMISAAAQANSSLGSIQKQAKDTASVLLSLKRAANTFGSFYLVKEGIGSLIEAQKQLQSIEYTMKAATGSGVLAADALAFVRKEADKLGLILPDSAQGFANLSASATAAGVSISAQKELFDAYAKSATTLHLSTEQSSRALLALEQMFAKGKIQAQELRLQLGQAIPGAAQRFQNAVMEMTKGTDLAGKSFDQLLAAGDLTTSKFLPALVSALQTSGRGWEQASTGLNANLNRVATAWFNLKTQVSSGLFNDAATAGAGLLASQLGHIATTLALIGSGALGRVVGSQIQSGVSAARNFGQKNITGPSMAATIDREEAEAALTAAKAERELAAAKAKSAAVTERSIRLVALDNANRRVEAEVARRMAADSAREAESEIARTGALANVVKTRNAFTTAEAQASTAAAQAVAAAEAKRVESAMRLTQALSSQGTAQKTMAALSRENIAAQKALAAADLEVARARAFADAPDPRSVELIARQAAAQEALAASNAMVAKAAKVEAQATAAANALKEQALVANANLERANATLAASEDAVAAAQARVAAMRELETATSSLAAMAGRAAKSFGAFALSLVGGPWGAAVIAVGALGYAIYSVQKASEDYRNETLEQNKSIQAMRLQVQAATADFNTLHGAMNTSQTIDVFGGALAGLDKTGAELADLRAQAEKLQKQIDSRDANAGTAILNWFDERKLAELQDRIATVGSAYHLAQSDVEGLREKLSLFPQAVDAITAALKGLKEGASFGDIWGRITASFSAATPALDELKAKVESEGAAINAMGEGFTAQAKRIGQSAHQQVQAAIDQRVADARKLGLAQKEIDKILAEGAPALAAADKKDAADAAKKASEAGISAANKQREAYASAVKAIQDRIAADQEQANSTSKILPAERERAKLIDEMNNGTLKVTASERARIIALLDTDVQLQKSNKAEQDHQRSLAYTAALEDQLATRIQNRRDQNAINAAGVGMGANEVQRMQDELRIRQDYQRQVDQLNKEANKPQNIGTASGIGGDDYNARLAEIAKAQRDETLLYRQGVTDRLAAESDWKNGATAAMQDYIDASANAASQSQQLWADAMTGMEDALTTFATTGKLTFRSFATDILKEIARIEMRAAISGLLGMFSSAFGSYGAAGTNSFNSAGFVSHVGGRAIGGAVSANRMYEVAEGGKPELLSTGGRTFLMMGGQAGNVAPTAQGARGNTGGGSAPNVNVNVQVVVNQDGTASSKSSTDDASARGKQIGDQMAAVCRQTVLRMMQPNGELWKEYAHG